MWGKSTLSKITQDLNSEELVPSYALLHQSPGGVNHIDDHCNDVAYEDDDHEELPPPALSTGGALSPVLQLHGEGRSLQGGKNVNRRRLLCNFTPFRSSSSDVFLLQHLTTRKLYSIKVNWIMHNLFSLRCKASLWFVCLTVSHLMCIRFSKCSVISASIDLPALVVTRTHHRGASVEWQLADWGGTWGESRGGSTATSSQPRRPAPPLWSCRSGGSWCLCVSVQQCDSLFNSVTLWLWLSEGVTLSPRTWLECEESNTWSDCSWLPTTLRPYISLITKFCKSVTFYITSFIIMKMFCPSHQG